MACSRFEPLIALYVEGDLAATEVEEHLLACDACRTFGDELQRTQVALRSLRKQEAPEAALAEVRNRVLDQVASRKPSWLFAFRMQRDVRPKTRAARGAAPRKPQESLLVKMFTDDPDVVIYWLIDQTGDSL